VRRVLVIESDEGLLRAIARNLRVHGFAVSTASSAGEGLCMLEGQNVVVVDLTLPDAHGTVVLRKIRRENWPVRVVFLRDAEDSTALAEAEALKPDLILHKLEIDRLLKWAGQL
jgi:DNA-binding response OmpR family regulator